MKTKRRYSDGKSKLYVIFLSLYIIGLVFSIGFSGNTTDLEESIRNSIRTMGEGNIVASIVRQFFSFFSVSLMMWAYCVILHPWRIISWLGILVFVFTGYSAGISSVIILRAFPGEGIWYLLLCIIPGAMMRFFLWHMFCTMSISSCNKRKSTYRYSFCIFVLFVILISDMLMSVLSVILSDIIF